MWPIRNRAIKTSYSWWVPRERCQRLYG